MEKGSKQARPSKLTWFSPTWTVFHQLISLEILARPWSTRPRPWCRTQSDKEWTLVFYQNMSRSQVISHPLEDPAPKIVFPMQTPGVLKTSSETQIPPDSANPGSSESHLPSSFSILGLCCRPSSSFSQWLPVFKPLCLLRAAKKFHFSMI